MNFRRLLTPIGSEIALVSSQLAISASQDQGKCLFQEHMNMKTFCKSQEKKLQHLGLKALREIKGQKSVMVMEIK